APARSPVPPPATDDGRRRRPTRQPNDQRSATGTTADHRRRPTRRPTAGRQKGTAMTDRLGELTAAGVAVRLDDLSRVRLSSGALDKLRREQHVVGVTTNPTIFAKALSDADEYNWQLRDLALRGVEVEEAVRALTTYDVRWACDVMRPAYDTSGGVD